MAEKRLAVFLIGLELNETSKDKVHKVFTPLPPVLLSVIEHCKTCTCVLGAHATFDHGDSDLVEKVLDNRLVNILMLMSKVLDFVNDLGTKNQLGA